MTKVAKRYGISDVGLKKVCTKLKVPVPKRGYWAKVQHGWRGKRPQLPEITGPEELVVQRWKTQRDESVTTEFQSKIIQEKSAKNQVVVAETMNSTHPLVACTQDNLKTAQREDDDMLKPTAQGCLDVQVSRASLDRAMRTMDALIKALESRGFTVSVCKGLEPESSVEILGEQIQFALAETVERIELELTETEKKEKVKNPWRYMTPRYEAVPSGNLVLIIKNDAGLGLRKRWADSEKKKIENQLNAFVAGLIRMASKAKTERLERERVMKEREELERRRAEMERRAIEEAEKTKKLDSEIAAWQKARTIRAYVDALREAAIQECGYIQPESPLDAWISWALELANRIDPLKINAKTLERSVLVV